MADANNIDAEPGHAHFSLLPSGDPLAEATILATIAAHGYAFVAYPAAAPLATLAHKFGDPVSSRPGQPLEDTLVPTPREQAKTHSISAHVGLGEFPFHT